MMSQDRNAHVELKNGSKIDLTNACLRQQIRNPDDTWGEPVSLEKDEVTVLSVEGAFIVTLPAWNIKGFRRTEDSIEETIELRLELDEIREGQLRLSAGSRVVLVGYQDDNQFVIPVDSIVRCAFEEQDNNKSTEGDDGTSE